MNDHNDTDGDSTWEQRMSERAFARSLIAAAQKPDPPEPVRDDELVKGWLARSDMTVSDAYDLVHGESPLACACVGSPWQKMSGDEPQPIYPCFCELAFMKAQELLGLPITGWDRSDW